MYACEKGYIEIVECLTSQESQVTLKDAKQRSAIFHALEAPGENLDVIVHLINKGADVN
jgi:hypothetical protein